MFILLILFSNTWPPNVFVWDNDGGQYINDPEIQERIGVEVNIIRALQYIGIDPVVSENLPDSAGLAGYDILFIVNGWREGDFISEKDRGIIKSYMNNGHCIYMEGNNVVYNYYNYYDPDFVKRFGVLSTDPGFPIGNVDTIIGVDGTPTEGLKYDYPYGTEPDSSVDRLTADESYGGQADTFFIGAGRGKAYWGTAVGYGFGAFKSDYYKTYTASFVFGALRSFTSVPDSIYRAVLMLRILAYFGWPRVLIVKDDALEGYDDSDRLVSDFSSAGKPYEIFTVQPRDTGPGGIYMSRYGFVFWDCGGDKDFTLSDIDQSNIREYLLAYEGRFVLMGSHVAYDLYVHGYGEFLPQYFRTQFIDTLWTTPPEVQGDDFLRGLDSPYDPTFSPRPSYVDSMYPGFPVYYYYLGTKPPLYTIAGVSYRYVDDGQGGARTTFFGFPWTGIRYYDVRLAVIDSLLSFGGGGNYLHTMNISLTAHNDGDHITLVIKSPEIPERIMIKRSSSCMCGEELIYDEDSRDKTFIYKDYDIVKNVQYQYRAGVVFNNKTYWSNIAEIEIKGIVRDIVYDPSKGILSVPENTEVSIFDISGRVIKTFNYGGQIALKSLLPAGIYFAKTSNSMDALKIEVIK